MLIKRTLTLLIFAFIFSYGHSQNVFPSSEDHPEWHVQRSIEPSLPGPVFVMSYHLEKDTIINQKTYSLVSTTGNRESLRSHERVGFIRSDAKKVFFKKSAKGKEYLLYDFGLHVGDKVYCPYYELDSAQYHVLAIDSVKLNGVKHLRLKVRPEDYYIDGPFMMYWLEGIGNLENPFYHDVFGRSGSSDEVRCFSTNAGMLYSNPNYDDCTTVLRKTDCIVNEGIVWSGMNVYKDQSGKDSVASYHIKFLGDTILNDRTYTKIWQSNDSLGVNWKLTGLIREVERQVYYHTLNYEGYADMLLYDFSVRTGNSLLLASIDNPGLYENMRVTNVDSIAINGDKKLRIQLSDGHDSDTWIEGIGSLQGVINHCYFEHVSIKRTLLCVQENGKTIYSNEAYPNCFYSNKSHSTGLNLMNSAYVWHDLVKTSEDLDCCTYTHSIKFSGDTVLNSMIYKKVLQSDDSAQTHWQTIGFVREDINKGLYYKNLYGTQEEQLLYNYNLELDDTVKIPDIFGDQDSSFFIVSNIENVFIDGSIRKKYLLVYPEYHNFTETWIEGIGSLSGILREGFFCLCNTNTLLCFYEDGQQVYNNPEYNTCFYTSAREISMQQEKFKIFPNPVSDQLFISTNQPGLGEATIEFYSATGALIRKECMDSGTNPFTLNLQGMKPGSYVVRIIPESGPPEEKVIVKR